jgi:hypothetical protein
LQAAHILRQLLLEPCSLLVIAAVEYAVANTHALRAGGLDLLLCIAVLRLLSGWLRGLDN